MNQKLQKKCHALPNVVQVTRQQCLFVPKHILNATVNVLLHILSVETTAINPKKDLQLANAYHNVHQNDHNASQEVVHHNVVKLDQNA